MTRINGAVELSETEAWELSQKNPEFAKLLSEAKPIKQQNIKAERVVKREYIELPFWERIHTIERKHLAILVTFGLLGAGFLIYQIYSHWQLSAIVAGIILVIVIAVKTKGGED